MEHIAIQNKKYTFGPITQLDIFCRCQNRKDPPYDKVSVGDLVYPLMNGIILCVADVSYVRSFEFSDISEVIKLCKGTDLDGANAFWDDMKDRRYATVIHILNNRLLPKPIVPRTRSFGSGWITLDNRGKRSEWLNL